MKYKTTLTTVALRLLKSGITTRVQVRTKLVIFLFFALISVSFQSPSKPDGEKKVEKVLLFSKTNGFRHESIAAGIAGIRKIGEEQQFTVDATEDSTVFTYGRLKQYAAIIFLNTTGDVLGAEQEKALQQYIQHGGGFVGVHAASDCEYGWPWYVKLIGGNFESHPKPQPAKLKVVDSQHPATSALPDVWERADEWYNFKNLNPDMHVLLEIDETSYTGGKNGPHHPMAWWHAYDGGRVFYTALGHTNESYAEPLFIQHLAGGIRYAMGRK
ncbi:ThuA domain-containing protein [Terrimonas pollutisoli]|uniref:ThuA domain-containing protein n=1 Tax=Terrimonas pollutisoli TaxID=3034147 RepID=UPI0023EB9013|nr:ThuA domain-containing protein [Terrimonas sp. H1YJ31]